MRSNITIDDRGRARRRRDRVRAHPYGAVGETGEDELAANAVTVRCVWTADGRVPMLGADEDLFAIVARSY